MENLPTKPIISEEEIFQYMKDITLEYQRDLQHRKIAEDMARGLPSAHLN